MPKLPLYEPQKASVHDKFTVAVDIAEWFERNNRTKNKKGYIPIWWADILYQLDEDEHE